MHRINDSHKKSGHSSFSKKLLNKLGPGFITGASDDDPSGLATYAQAGAQFGMQTLWMPLWTIPLMVSIQEMAGRIGLVTSGCITHSFLKKFSRPVVWFIVGSLVVANTINIGADIAGMAESVTLIIGVPKWLAAVVFSFCMITLQVYLPYRTYVTILKWCTVSLLSYIVAAVALNLSWKAITFHTLFPSINLKSYDFWYIVTAILGTTISPYLMVWQSNQEVEEQVLRGQTAGKPVAITDDHVKRIHHETWLGMFFSNLIMFFIIAVTASVLFTHKGVTINSMAQAASALEPIAGKFASWLFAFGVIGTGMLAIPVLAGSSAYALAALLGWDKGLYLSWSQASKFYSVIIISTLVGLVLNFININAVDFLLGSAVLNSLVTPILIVGLLLVGNDESVLGIYKNTTWSNIGGVLTLLFFVVSFGGFFVSYLLHTIR